MILTFGLLFLLALMSSHRQSIHEGAKSLLV